MKKPNFFIAGAPKCGTTSLAQWLGEHSQIYLSPSKEPHFFNTDGLRETTTLEKYESLFQGADSKHIAVGEASTHYLYSKEAVANILAYSPDARFIVCLRNPIEMAPSLYEQRVYMGRETARSFEEAWLLQEQRRAGKMIPFALRRDPERLQYGAYCKLGSQLQRLYSQVDRERILPILLDDMKTDPASQYQRVLKFLGVAGEHKTHFPVFNRAKIIHRPRLIMALRWLGRLRRRLGIGRGAGISTWIINSNMQVGSRLALSKEIKHELKDYFSEDVALLGHLLNRDLSHWIASS